ncbi:MAG: SUMF1/EgtB/PvdO family nonheme iron enzyme, partial [Myxococcota bacterium]
GNVWEYTQDVYHPGVYTISNQRTDPGGPARGTVHTLRGGAWDANSRTIRVSARRPDLVEGLAVGFRCARLEAKPKPAPLEPMRTVSLSGEFSMTTPEGERPPKILGERIWLSAFPAGLTTAAGEPLPDAIPAARISIKPNRRPRQRFSLDVPANRPYRLRATLETEEQTHLARLPDLFRASDDTADIKLVFASIDPPSGMDDAPINPESAP